jgi:four helix bundle protein
MIKPDTPVSFFRFEDLRIYAKALEYITWLHNVITKFPNHEQPTLAQPFLKVAQSIALHLAEGSARNKPQFIYYLKMAKSSVRECVVYTEIASRLGLMNEANKEYSVTQMMELTKMIGSLVTSLQRTIPNGSKEEDEFDDMHLPPDII